MFNAWFDFINSDESTHVLSDADNGWFGPQASEAIPNFDTTFECDPTAPSYGFKSWDDFFTRKFRDGVRPIEFEDSDSFINSACESTVYNIVRKIKVGDRLWLKEQPYSWTC